MDSQCEVSGSESSDSEGEVEDLPSDSDMEFIDNTDLDTREDKLHKLRDLRRKRLQDDAS